MTLKTESMKDITIRSSSIIRELLILLAMLIAAIFTNVYAIHTYDGQWGELLSQIHIVLILSVVYYLIVALVRSIIYGVYKIVLQFKKVTG